MLRLNRRSFLLLASFLGVGFVLRNYKLFAVNATISSSQQAAFKNLEKLVSEISIRPLSEFSSSAASANSLPQQQIFVDLKSGLSSMKNALGITGDSELKDVSSMFPLSNSTRLKTLRQQLNNALTGSFGVNKEFYVAGNAVTSPADFMGKMKFLANFAGFVMTDITVSNRMSGSEAGKSVTGTTGAQNSYANIKASPTVVKK